MFTVHTAHIVRWRFRKNLWPSQNIWTLVTTLLDLHLMWKTMFAITKKNILMSVYFVPRLITLLILGLGKCFEFRCPENYAPICGNDGKTYKNQCHLFRTKCLGKNSLGIASNGKCPGRISNQNNSFTRPYQEMYIRGFTKLVVMSPSRGGSSQSSSWRIFSSTRLVTFYPSARNQISAKTSWNFFIIIYVAKS